ncbi:hypothetical protein BDV06DRAFT_229833 [Aspergillus oleicola]
MDEITDYETTDVVICGCGPTGALLSAYLSQMSVKHVVVEKHPTITTDPRGIALDEDGIRFLQGIGLYDKIYTDIGSCMQEFQFIGGRKKLLDQMPFLQMDYSTTEGGTGHVGFICHKQPVLEQHLRQAMQSEFCVLRCGCSLSYISQDDEWTYCHYIDEQGLTHRVRSRFFVGADGKTGFTRKNYLEPLGVHMEFANNTLYDETWVALNWELTVPTEQTHPDFPLWANGLTPEQIYDAFFPPNFRFLCNPDRPAVCGRFGLPTDRLWRFEFVVKAGEDGDQMATKEMIQKVVYPYITHSGSRYVLSQDVQFPEDCIRVLRVRPFHFAARSCNRWTHGRVILCGDAAHVFPPFGGQGIASGFRDAASLAWRLALLCRDDHAPPRASHERVLRAWYLERKQQLEQSLASTVENGRFVTERNPLAVFLRNLVLFIRNIVPQWRRDLRLGRRREGMVRYTYEEGMEMPFLPGDKGGVCLPQGYCKPLPVSVSAAIVRTGKGESQQEGTESEQVENCSRVYFTDDVIFSHAAGGYRRLFRLVVYLQQLSDLPAAARDVADIEEISRGEIHTDDVTFLVRNHGIMVQERWGQELAYSDMTHLHCVLRQSTYQIATGEEFAASPLCFNRPEPRFYDPYYIEKILGETKYVVVRPDRFIFAAVNDRQGLRRVVAAAADYCQGA